MLVISRKCKEGIILRTADGIVRITVADTRGNRAKIGITAPKTVHVLRSELDGNDELPIGAKLDPTTEPPATAAIPEHQKETAGA